MSRAYILVRSSGQYFENLFRDSKRREGNTWREINRIVDRVTEPEPKKEIENRIEQPKKSITKVSHENLNPK